MNIEQLTGRYLRLKQELEIARRRSPWQTAHICRLVSDLSAVESELGSTYGLSKSPEHPAPGVTASPGARPIPAQASPG